MESVTEVTHPRETAHGNDETAAATVIRRLRETRAEVDSVLECVPHSKDEARRYITRELGFEPRVEELQVLVKVAAEADSKGARRELPRQLLVVRVMADREQKRFFDTPQLNASEIQHSAMSVKTLLQAVELVEEELAATLDSDGISTVDREFLLQAGEALRSPVELLQAADLLAPRLEFLVEAAECGALQSLMPTMTGDDAEIFIRSVGDDQSQEGPSRACIDAMALRTIIQETVSIWEQLTDADDGEARTQLIEQLRVCKSAHHVVAQRLQKQQDIALLAGLDKFAEELRAVSSGLFSAYLKLAPIVREAGGLPKRILRPSVKPDASVQKLLNECAEAVQPSRETHEKTLSRLDRAVSSVRTQALDTERHQGRFFLLLTVAAALFVAFLIVNSADHGGPPPSIEVTPAAFSHILNLAETRGLGTLLYARVTSKAELGAAGQEWRKVGLIGRVATSRGFEAVYLVNDEGEPLATWSLTAGATLLEPNPTPTD